MTSGREDPRHQIEIEKILKKQNEEPKQHEERQKQNEELKNQYAADQQTRYRKRRKRWSANIAISITNQS